MDLFVDSRMTPSVISDEAHISDLITKKLMRENKSSTKALRFATLFNKLQAQTILKRKWAVLYFLMSVSEQSNDGDASKLATTLFDQTFSHRGLESISHETGKVTETQNTFISNVNPTSIQETIKEPVYMQEDEQYYDLPPRVVLQKKVAEAENTMYEISEALLLRDIVFVFQGIDGQYIKFDKTTGSYLVDSKIGVQRSTRELISRLSEMGCLYRKVHAFVNDSIDDISIGLVGQAFCSALQRELTEYYKLMAILESQITKEVDTNLSTQSIPLSLKRMLVSINESAEKLRLMAVLVDGCARQKGGALVSYIYMHTNHGDPFRHEFVEHILEEVSKPFYEMLQSWIYEGELEDPFEEFFVGCDQTVEEEDLWQHKYFMRTDMQPSFISPLLAKKIFSIGKSLNFIRYSCHDNDLVTGKGKSTKSVLKYGDVIALEHSIDATYTKTSKRLLDILFTKYKLMEHLAALKRYLLLGQGDFVQYLMDQLGSGLSKPANTLHRHNLTGTLEAAIRASNAQYEDQDILQRLDVRLANISAGDVGWDVFSLDYHVDSPINTIFTPPAMILYTELFRFLWRLKRVEHDLSAAWRRQMTCARTLAQIPEMEKDINNSRLVCSEMIHFVYQLQYYLLFEVVGCSWDVLETDINKKSGDLDSLIEMHNRYLNDITTKGFLRTSDQDYLPSVLKIIGFILQYKNVLDELYNFVVKELMRREHSNIQPSRKGKSEREAREAFLPIQRKLGEVASSFKGELVNLLAELANHKDTDFRFLSVRLDFNEFYSAQKK
ncbi:6398_t:CDS:10 [Paraglomus occultum]|uniref:6398_t:CDS:1 n=1 Tax=Paraglomus occultum TaxID=144539 RepID=A0A9N8Z0M1_9GLOM|nr:6398_t:CDS:10 [Paraglomus occultum]